MRRCLRPDLVAAHVQQQRRRVPGGWRRVECRRGLPVGPGGGGGGRGTAFLVRPAGACAFLKGVAHRVEGNTFFLVVSEGRGGGRALCPCALPSFDPPPPPPHRIWIPPTGSADAHSNTEACLS